MFIVTVLGEENQRKEISLFQGFSKKKPRLSTMMVREMTSFWSFLRILVQKPKNESD